MYRIRQIRNYLYVPVLLAASLCLMSCKSKTPDPTHPKPFRIGMVTFAGYAPLYLAKEKGLFGAENVELVRIEDIPSLRAAMARKDLDAYLATPDIALDTNAAPPGQAVWAIDESAGGDGVVVAGNIHDLSDLKGKKIAAEPGLPPHFVLLYLLDKSGMTKNDVSIQDMSTQDAAAAFAAKSVDAAGIYEPFLSEALKQRQGSRVALSSKQAPDMIVDLIFVRDDDLTTRAADITNVIAGWRKAVDLIHQDPNGSYPIMAKAFNMSVSDFKDSSGGVVWLDLKDNQRLFGSAQDPGVLYNNFNVVYDVKDGGLMVNNAVDQAITACPDKLERYQLRRLVLEFIWVEAWFDYICKPHGEDRRSLIKRVHDFGNWEGDNCANLYPRVLCNTRNNKNEVSWERWREPFKPEGAYSKVNDAYQLDKNAPGTLDVSERHLCQRYAVEKLGWDGKEKNRAYPKWMSESVPATSE